MRRITKIRLRKTVLGKRQKAQTARRPVEHSALVKGRIRLLLGGGALRVAAPSSISASCGNTRRTPPRLPLDLPRWSKRAAGRPNNGCHKQSRTAVSRVASPQCVRCVQYLTLALLASLYTVGTNVVRLMHEPFLRRHRLPGWSASPLPGRGPCRSLSKEACIPPPTECGSDVGCPL